MAKRNPESPSADYTVVFGAGGTGGHLFPAIAVAQKLRTLAGRKLKLVLIIDRRGKEFVAPEHFHEVYTVRSAGVSGKGLIGKFLALFALGWGYFSAARLLKTLKPAAVIGFGGYASVPVVMSAIRRGYPTVIHEQNAVLGRSNRVLAGGVDRLALSFHPTAMLPTKALERNAVVQTGNPVREAVLAHRHQPFVHSYPTDPFHLLVFGGSQGAQRFASIVPQCLAMLNSSNRRRLVITQQAREEDIERLRQTYADLGIEAYLTTFFDDLPQRISEAHLVIARAGAMTVAELTVIGRPAILIPYPHAADNHQMANAERFVENGAGWLFDEMYLTTEQLAERVESLMEHAEWLGVAAACAKEQSELAITATENLTKQVLQLIYDNENATLS